MFQRSTFPRVLLLLAVFVFFSANTVHFVEKSDGRLWASDDKRLHFDYDDAATLGPRVNLHAAIVVNYENGKVLYMRNADKPRSIASISKLVAAMVVIDKDVNWDTTEVITKKDAYRSSRSRLRVGYEVTLKDLMVAGLMNSDNRAMRALARASYGSIEAFAKAMNRKVKELGLKHTVFYEPTGLDSRNKSTAEEVAKILHYSYEYDMIREITADKRDRVKVVNKRNKTLPMANTNLMVHSRHKVLAGKTGYIRAAGYCLTTLIENNEGEKLTVVVLGVPGDRLRFREARKLADYCYKRLDKLEAAAAQADVADKS